MHCQFALIVTGHGERDFLPSLFRSIMARANCSFFVLRKVGQRRPIVSAKKQLKMVGTGKVIPDIDEQDIGLPARSYLRDRPSHYVVLVDDIERGWRPQLASVFSRYRKALDTMLRPDERTRAAVHFFANMLEAYYFADSAASNGALGRAVLAHDHADDVEEIPHPKNELKRLYAGFDECEHGQAIVEGLDLDHVLARPETCAFLRSLFGWCVESLSAGCEVHDPDFPARYRLADGQRAEPMRSQTVP